MLEGLCFEDFISGKVYTTDRRTITETDVVNFMTLCAFFEPLFMDLGYVETETPFKKRIAPGALTFSFAEGLTMLTRIIHNTGMAFLGVDMEIIRPVFIGDTISVEIEVVEKRETKKRDRGVITFLHRVKNQKDELVMEYKVKRMIRRRT
nr:acyl dehydratase [Desulfobacterales bacterium]